MDGIAANNTAGTPNVTEPNNEPHTQEPFKTFATEQEYNDFAASLRKRAEKDAAKAMAGEDGKALDLESLREKIRKEEYEKVKDVAGKEAVEKYKRQLEMTEQERFEERQKEFDAMVKAKSIDFNRREAKQIMKEAGISDERIEMELEFVTDDRDSSIGRIIKLCDMFKTEKEIIQKDFLKQFGANNPSISIGAGDPDNLQAQYDKAKKERNFAEMSRVIRVAQQNKITLKD